MGGVTLGGIAYGVYSMSKHKKNDKNTDKTTDTASTTSASDGEGSGSSSGSGTNDSSSSKTKKKTVVEDVPITNYKEALEFANREWNKLKRGNGRSLECQVLGATQWQAGEWCKVYLPSFDIDGYMYIIRTSQSSEGGDWTSNLSLVDYPPGWGKEEIEEKTEEDSDSDKKKSDEENTDTENTEESTS